VRRRRRCSSSQCRLVAAAILRTLAKWARRAAAGAPAYCPSRPTIWLPKPPHVSVSAGRILSRGMNAPCSANGRHWPNSGIAITAGRLNVPKVEAQAISRSCFGLRIAPAAAKVVSGLTGRSGWGDCFPQNTELLIVPRRAARVHSKPSGTATRRPPSLLEHQPTAPAPASAMLNDLSALSQAFSHRAGRETPARMAPSGVLGLDRWRRGR